MTTLVPKYDQGDTGAVNRPFNKKLQETVSVLDFGADPTGVADSTTAFTNALAATGSIYVPVGEYLVGEIPLDSQNEIIGENMIYTTLKANATNANIFVVPASATYIKISNLGASSNGHTGTTFFYQTDQSVYIAHATFSNLNLWCDLYYGFRASFIYAHWDQCIIGLTGTVGATHIAVTVKDTSATPSAGHTLNLNRMSNCFMFQGKSSTVGDAIVNVYNGDMFLFDNCSFESSTIRAIHAEGVRELKFLNCWFEACGDLNTIQGITSALSSHGTLMSLDSCRFSNLSGPTSTVFLLDGASQAAINNTEFVGGSAGLVVQGGGGNVIELSQNTYDSTPTGFNNILSKNRYNLSGTFQVLFSTGGGSVTIDTNFDTLYYTCVRDLCHVQGRIKVASVSTPTGALVITGLPFTAIDSTETSGIAGFQIPYETLAAATANGLIGIIGEGTTSIEVKEQTTTTVVNTAATNMGANTLLYLNFWYKFE